MSKITNAMTLACAILIAKYFLGIVLFFGVAYWIGNIFKLDNEKNTTED